MHLSNIVIVMISFDMIKKKPTEYQIQISYVDSLILRIIMK